MKNIIKNFKEMDVWSRWFVMFIWGMFPLLVGFTPLIYRNKGIDFTIMFIIIWTITLISGYFTAERNYKRLIKNG